jgi:dTDP-4-amino-4,6-dideoxygalactose transaminase
MSGNAFAIVAEFERRVAEYAGARHAVATDCCSNAIFLSLQWWKVLSGGRACALTLPAKTYVSVPMYCLHAGYDVKFEDLAWQGVYRLKPIDIWDGAKRFSRGMYQGGLHCLSFHAKKIIPIGRGGMILTDDAEAAKWLRRARYDGRDGLPYAQEEIASLGWHAYMTPEQAARGLQLLDVLPEGVPDLIEDYPDLRNFPIFREKQRLAA